MVRIDVMIEDAELIVRTIWQLRHFYGRLHAPPRIVSTILRPQVDDGPARPMGGVREECEYAVTWCVNSHVVSESIS